MPIALVLAAILAGPARADKAPDRPADVRPAAAALLAFDAAPVEVPPTGATAAPAAAAPAAAPSGPRVWVWMERNLPATQDTTIRTAPDDTAAPGGTLAKGQTVFVVGLLEDREWLQVHLPDTASVGYIHAAAVAAGEPPPPDRPAPLPVSGRPVVHDTATLLVEDQAVALDGIEGFGGTLVDALQHYLDQNGQFVACDQQASGAYRCLTRDGTDVASVALVNGVARLLPDAPDIYAPQQAAAQLHQRGIWAASAVPVPAPPPPPVPLLPEWETDFYALQPAVVPEDDPGGDPGDPADPADFAAYGAVVIDGLPVTVIDGERVVIVHDPGRGWGYRDRALRWHGPPRGMARALDRRFGDHPPFFAGRPVRLADVGRAMGRGPLGEPLVHRASVVRPDVSGRPGLGHPESGHPESGHPEPGHPEPGHPESGHPESGHPESGHSEPGHPESAHPESGHPESGHPEPGHPGVPQGGAPHGPGGALHPEARTPEAAGTHAPEPGLHPTAPATHGPAAPTGVGRQSSAPGAVVHPAAPVRATPSYRPTPAVRAPTGASGYMSRSTYGPPGAASGYISRGPGGAAPRTFGAAPQGYGQFRPGAPGGYPAQRFGPAPGATRPGFSPYARPAMGSPFGGARPGMPAMGRPAMPAMGRPAMPAMNRAPAPAVRSGCRRAPC